jgi:hypothetical protein
MLKSFKLIKNISHLFNNLILKLLTSILIYQIQIMLIHFLIIIISIIFTLERKQNEQILFLERNLYLNQKNISYFKIKEGIPVSNIKNLKQIAKGDILEICSLIEYDAYFYVYQTSRTNTIFSSRFTKNFTKEIYSSYKSKHNLRCLENYLYRFTFENKKTQIYKTEIFSSKTERINIIEMQIHSFEIFENSLYFVINDNEMCKLNINGGGFQLLFKENFGKIISFKILNNILYYITSVFLVEYNLKNRITKILFVNQERTFIFNGISPSQNYIYLSSYILQTNDSKISSIYLNNSINEIKTISIRNDSYINKIFYDIEKILCKKNCNMYGGFCKNNECNCFEGWNGIYCEKCNSIILCNGHGKCSQSSVSCTCDNGYIGERCQTPICFGKAANEIDVCSNNGECIDYNKCK